MVESITRDDIFAIAKKHYQLADKLDMVRQKFFLEETDFDFFRFKHERVFSDRIRRQIKQKFRVALGKFFRKYKKGKADIPPALKILKEF